MLSRRRLLLLPAIAAVLVLSIVSFAFTLRRAVGSPPAVSPPPMRPPIRADGRVVAEPGARVSLSSEISGTVRSVEVSLGQRVKRGDRLVDLVKAEQIAAIEERQAEVAEAHTRLQKQRDERQRAKKLAASGAVPPQTVDDTAHEENAAFARTVAAGAASRRVNAMLAKTRIISPIDGVVVMRAIEPGETVLPGARLVDVVDLDHLRIEAEVDEYYLGRIAAGAAARVSAEGFPGREWAGKVDELGFAVVARALHPLDPRRPADVGVLPVWINLPSGHPLRLGQRVDVTITPATGGALAMAR